MKPRLALAYGVCCHLMFLGLYAYMAGFVGGLLVPKTIDSPSDAPVWQAVLINLGLLGLFGAQHSIMARPAFKKVWTRWVPPPVERSTYVLASCLVTALLMWQWQGLTGVVWQIETPVLKGLVWMLFAAGWLMVPAVSLLIDHFDLFGTRQVWLYYQGRPYQPLPFRKPLLYRTVRHPLYIGWALAFWAVPTMTVGHLLFAGVLTLYMAAAAHVEERDLTAHFGRDYEQYRRDVPMFLPRILRRTNSSTVR